MLAHSERDFCHEQMSDAYATRELLVKVLAEIDDTHHYRGSAVCLRQAQLQGRRAARRPPGRAAGPQLRRGARTLRELRNANPELWADTWDYIDVTLVYPKRSRRAGGGRHRAPADRRGGGGGAGGT